MRKKEEYSPKCDKCVGKIVLINESTILRSFRLMSSPPSLERFWIIDQFKAHIPNLLNHQV